MELLMISKNGKKSKPIVLSTNFGRLKVLIRTTGKHRLSIVLNYIIKASKGKRIVRLMRLMKKLYTS